jgi:PAS domain-containing protein
MVRPCVASGFRRVGDELHASEQRMSLVAIAANLRFWIWEISRNEVWASKSDWSNRSWSPSEPVTFERFIEEAVHPDDRDSVRQAVRRALEINGEYQAEYRVVLPASSMRWIAGRGRIELDQNGKPRRLLAVSIDVTERRQAEDAARDLSGQLINAQEKERARLARALHDDVTQRLALLAIEAGSKERGLGDAVGRKAMRERQFGERYSSKHGRRTATRRSGQRRRL